MKKLRFVFQGCNKITDEGLDDFCEGLKQLSLLEDLSLSLMHQLSKITDKGVHWLDNCIKRLPGLKSLELNFGFCNGISAVRVEGLSNRLKNLRKLESFSLGFSDCGQMTDSGLHNLCKRLKSLNGSLKSLSLNFYKGDMTDVGLKFI